MGARINSTSSRHRLRSGQLVTVLRLPTVGPPYLEGRAVLGACESGLYHRVRFDGDPEWRLRPVHAVLQAHAELIAAALIDLWRAEQTQRASFSDFFPSANPND